MEMSVSLFFNHNLLQIKYNFNNDEAVRTLSKAILKEDFSLDVSFFLYGNIFSTL